MSIYSRYFSPNLYPMRLPYWILFGTLLFLSCKKEAVKLEATEAETQFTLLQAHTWIPGSVTRDGTSLTDDFADFTLIISGTLNAEKSNVTNGMYETNGKNQVLTNGSWEFNPDVPTTTLLLTDNANGQIEVSYTVTNTSLYLNFVRTVSNGRTTGISGNYIFDLIPQ